MQVPGRVTRQILLLSLLVMIVPMIVFPEQFGFRLGQASFRSMAYEFVFYGLVIFLFNRRASLWQLLQISGVCLLYRFGIGVLFGLLITVMYSMQLTVSLILGMFSYLPAVFLHIAAAPFILMPLIRLLYRFERRPQRLAEPVRSDAPPTAEPHQETGPVSLVASKERGYRPPPPPRPKPTQNRRPTGDSKNTVKEVNGFDLATRHVGEDASVQLVTLVDAEGLLLSRFARGDMDAADYAPYSMLFFENAQTVLDRSGLGVSEKMDLIMATNRVILVRDNGICLMVMAERRGDDLLNIRVNQGMDIVKKYMTERYGDNAAANVEKTYVSSTQ